MERLGAQLQDPFLNALRKEQIAVFIYLMNGIKLQGQIKAFDRYAVLLYNTGNQLVFKHAIATVVPAQRFRWRAEKYQHNPSEERPVDD